MHIALLCLRACRRQHLNRFRALAHILNQVAIVEFGGPTQSFPRMAHFALLEPALRPEEEPDDFTIYFGHRLLHAGGGVESMCEFYTRQHICDLAQPFCKDSQLLSMVLYQLEGSINL